ncbi:MAG: VOC family protein [Gammaproteobacteria bacterium]|nr:VOC family protein [Gammaproteobacteria bacterium]MDH5802904.1 VOC family protein [Gammaproteobacteria bacterium]
MGNPFCHIELMSQDRSGSAEFYGRLFDWELVNMPMQNTDQPYTMINVGEGTGGGMMQHPEADQPSAWYPYVGVSDVAATIKQALALGATVIKDKSEVPEHGWYGVIADPNGAVIGLWENRE